MGEPLSAAGVLEQIVRADRRERVRRVDGVQVQVGRGQRQVAGADEQLVVARRRCELEVQNRAPLSVSPPSVSVPMPPLPAASMPPLATVAAPANEPVPPSVAPEATVIAPAPSAGMTNNVPLLTDVVPE